MTAFAPAIDDEVRTWDWTRLPQQDHFIWDRSRFAIWQGGRGSTKTSSGMFRLWMTISDPNTGRIRKEWAGANILIAAPVLKQLQRGPKEVFDDVFDDSGLVLKKINGHSPRRELRDNVNVYFFNVGPAGEGAESWRGSKYAIAMLDEAAQMPEKTFNLANATLRQRRRNDTPYAFQTIITTTPLGKNWLWKRFLNRDTRMAYLTEAGEPMYPDERVCIIETSTKDSIAAGIMEADYADNVGYAPGSLMWQQEVEGKVIGWAGLVFEQGWKLIDPNLNKQPDAFVAVYGAVDVGQIDPTAIIVVGIDLRGAIWVLREFYKARADFKDWIGLVGEWTKEFGIRKWFVDNDITARMMRNGAGLIARTPDKSKDAAGVAVNFINHKITEGAFHVHPSCVGLLSEMRGYEYRAEFDGEAVTFLQKVKPGQPDHAIDALRYAAMPLTSAQAQQQYGKEVSYSIG